ncbi:MAG: hypothetical protein GC152_03640 [Alphaproteobacteria bacterium]|nr:hypothetical protein [Alphaproteobacteria bacterium]
MMRSIDDLNPPVPCSQLWVSMPRRRLTCVALFASRSMLAPSCKHGTRIKPAGAKSRNGFGTAEIIVCLIMLGSLASWLVPLLHTVKLKHAQIAERARLQQVAMNVAQRLAVMPKETASESLIELAHEQHAQLTLTAGETNAQGLRRIDLTMTPLDPRDLIRPIRLTTWIREHDDEQR